LTHSSRLEPARLKAAEKGSVLPLLLEVAAAGGKGRRAAGRLVACRWLPATCPMLREEGAASTLLPAAASIAAER
jgi:hypothetical protein